MSLRLGERRDARWEIFASDGPEPSTRHEVVATLAVFGAWLLLPTVATRTPGPEGSARYVACGLALIVIQALVLDALVTIVARAVRRWRA